MLHFRTNVFARPAKVSIGLTVKLRGKEFSTLGDPEGGPVAFLKPFPMSFEDIQQRLAKVPRMDIEPDGYFLVAGGEKEGQRWQIDGHLFEYDGKLHRVEMHGSCSRKTIDEVLACLGTMDVVFQLVHEGVTLDFSDFFSFAQLPCS